MNENKRNETIVKHEDDGLDQHLDSWEVEELDNPCECCEEEEATIEFDDKMMCQSCYEDACEHAQMRAESAYDDMVDNQIEEEKIRKAEGNR